MDSVCVCAFLCSIFSCLTLRMLKNTYTASILRKPRITVPPALLPTLVSLKNVLVITNPIIELIK